MLLMFLERTSVYSAFLILKPLKILCIDIDTNRRFNKTLYNICIRNPVPKC